MVVLLPGNLLAQMVLPPDEAPRRVAILQIGGGYTMPMASFAAAENPLVISPNGGIASFGDGFARYGTTLNFGVCIPISQSFDFVTDLLVPNFKMKTREFRQQSNMYIAHARYLGKLLSVGARWFPLKWSWGRGFLIGTAGMYQLINDRILSGTQVVERGAFKAGGALGVGFELSNLIVPMDVVLRFHRYTDYGHFVQGDIAWVELALHLSFPLEEER
ncbi:hypothetical protein ACFL3H_04155 [Gemmatimonadota bacterium]